MRVVPCKSLQWRGEEAKRSCGLAACGGRRKDRKRGETEEYGVPAKRGRPGTESFLLRDCEKITVEGVCGGGGGASQHLEISTKRRERGILGGFSNPSIVREVSTLSEAKNQVTSFNSPRRGQSTPKTVLLFTKGKRKPNS